MSVELVTVSRHGRIVRPSWSIEQVDFFLRSGKPTFTFTHTCTDNQTRKLTIVPLRDDDPDEATARLIYPGGNQFLIYTGEYAHMKWTRKL